MEAGTGFLHLQTSSDPRRFLHPVFRDAPGTVFPTQFAAFMHLCGQVPPQCQLPESIECPTHCTS